MSYILKRWFIFVSCHIYYCEKATVMAIRTKAWVSHCTNPGITLTHFVIIRVLVLHRLSQEKGERNNLLMRKMTISSGWHWVQQSRFLEIKGNNVYPVCVYSCTYMRKIFSFRQETKGLKLIFLKTYYRDVA